jgi:hypothetical protein
MNRYFRYLLLVICGWIFIGAATPIRRRWAFSWVIEANETDQPVTGIVLMIAFGANGANRELTHPVIWP